jgi:hypothetical protein
MLGEFSQDTASRRSPKAVFAATLGGKRLVLQFAAHETKPIRH